MHFALRKRFFVGGMNSKESFLFCFLGESQIEVFGGQFNERSFIFQALPKKLPKAFKVYKSFQDIQEESEKRKNVLLFTHYCQIRG